jgi:hypothetical protein
MAPGAPATAAPATVAGVEIVTIPMVEYAGLLDCRRRLAEFEARERAFKTASKSPIERDPEVAAFLASRFGLATVAVIREECIALFGTSRTPTKSSIYRYWSRLRSRRD